MLRASRRSRKVLVWVGFRIEWSCVGQTLLSDKSRGLEAGMGISLVDCRVRVQTKVKSVGQECPTHTRSAIRRFYECAAGVGTAWVRRVS